MPTSPELRVSVDIGCHQHSVAIGLSNGELLEEFDIAHRPEGFAEFFTRIEKHQEHFPGAVSVAMEGYNGFARPLDAMVCDRQWRLFNINNLKLARFKEVFPAAAKTDRLDARRGLELFQLREQLPRARETLQRVHRVPSVNAMLKRFMRRRRALVNERVRVLGRLQSDLQAVCPGLLEITGDAGNLWFLRLLGARRELSKLAKLRHQTLLSIPSIGRHYAELIGEWQRRALFSAEVSYVGPMIHDDAHRILDLGAQIKELEQRCTALLETSQIGRCVETMPGFALVCSAELAGEIGTLDRFAGEASLALYLGMANLDNSSGIRQGSKAPRQVNTRAKSAMMTGVDRHRKQVSESQCYYEKKRAEGKSHNQAIRALGRHLCRVLYQMLKHDRPYERRE